MQLGGPFQSFCPVACIIHITINMGNSGDGLEQLGEGGVAAFGVFILFKVLLQRITLRDIRLRHIATG